MSLLKCPECGKEVSDKAGVCPNCGFPIEKKDEKDVNEMADNSEEITDKEKKTSKKGLFLFVSVIILAALGGIVYYASTADVRDYEKANELYVDKKYEEALAIYSELGEYEDSQKLVAECEKEIGMMTNADYDFLGAIEKAVANRMKMSEEENKTHESLVNAELSILSAYEDATFYDKKLGNLAKQYIDGLKIQKEALDLKYSEYQIKWQEGIVKRYETLSDLHEQYGIFENNTDFESNYIAQVDANKRLLEAYTAIDEDMMAQLDNVMFEYVDYCLMSAPYTNNTSYDFDANFYFTFYNEAGDRIDESQEYISNIKSGDNCVLKFYCPETSWDSCEFFWEIGVY